jgi:hypothetical protein
MTPTLYAVGLFLYGEKWATQIYVSLVHDVNQIKKPQQTQQQDGRTLPTGLDASITTEERCRAPTGVLVGID